MSEHQLDLFGYFENRDNVNDFVPGYTSGNITGEISLNVFSKENTPTPAEGKPDISSEPTSTTNFYMGTQDTSLGSYKLPEDASDEQDPYNTLDSYTHGYRLRTDVTGVNPATGEIGNDEFAGIFAEEHNVLRVDHGRPFIATQDAHVATKKYVDDAMTNQATSNTINSPDGRTNVTVNNNELRANVNDANVLEVVPESFNITHDRTINVEAGIIENDTTYNIINTVGGRDLNSGNCYIDVMGPGARSQEGGGPPVPVADPNNPDRMAAGSVANLFISSGLGTTLGTATDPYVDPNGDFIRYRNGYDLRTTTADPNAENNGIFAELYDGTTIQRRGTPFIATQPAHIITREYLENNPEDVNLQAGNDIDIIAGDDVSIDARAGNVNIRAFGTTQDMGEGDVNIDATDDVHIDAAQNVTVDADNDITIRAQDSARIQNDTGDTIRHQVRVDPNFTAMWSTNNRGLPYPNGRTGNLKGHSNFDDHAAMFARPDTIEGEGKVLSATQNGLTAETYRTLPNPPENLDDPRAYWTYEPFIAEQPADITTKQYVDGAIEDRAFTRNPDGSIILSVLNSEGVLVGSLSIGASGHGIFTANNSFGISAGGSTIGVDSTGVRLNRIPFSTAEIMRLKELAGTTSD